MRGQMRVVVAVMLGFMLMGYQGIEVEAAGERHEGKEAFHAEVAHALLEMNTTLDMIEAYRAQEGMPPDKDAKHEKAAHGFKHALELFGIPIKMHK